MKIISSNYRDRNSKFKWLIRDAKEPAEKAVPVKRVVATGVTFKAAPDYETGFGCSMIAVAKEAEGFATKGKNSDVKRHETPLQFNGYSFRANGKTTVENVKELSLDGDGKMTATL